MFIYPMWDNESQRIAKLKCTPMGSRLHSVAELIGFLCLVSLPLIALYLSYRGFARTFHSGLWFAIAFPFAIALLADALYAFSWHLAKRRGFEYDYDRREASWIDAGERVSFRYSSDSNKQPSSFDPTPNDGG